MTTELPAGLKSLAPSSDAVTQYDRDHLQEYVKLLDAVARGMNDDEMCGCILKIDPSYDRSQAHQTLESHIRRAQWMTKTGFRQI
jgi:hypothetical protein